MLTLTQPENNTETEHFYHYIHIIKGEFKSDAVCKRGMMHRKFLSEVQVVPQLQPRFDMDCSGVITELSSEGCFVVCIVFGAV